jgi:hypothetical protein
MNNIDWRAKLSSRKLWACLAGILTGLAMAFGLDQNVSSTVAGGVTAVASVMADIAAEGRVDAERIKIPTNDA